MQRYWRPSEKPLCPELGQGWLTLCSLLVVQLLGPQCLRKWFACFPPLAVAHRSSAVCRACTPRHGAVLTLCTNIPRHVGVALIHGIYSRLAVSLPGVLCFALGQGQAVWYIECISSINTVIGSATQHRCWQRIALIVCIRLLDKHCFAAGVCWYMCHASIDAGPFPAAPEQLVVAPSLVGQLLPSDWRSVCRLLQFWLGSAREGQVQLAPQAPHHASMILRTCNWSCDDQRAKVTVHQ